MKRVCPPYFVCLFITVFLFSGNLFSQSGLGHIVSHALFFHNLVPEFHGSINGALWTMGTIVQFYLIAPLLFKCFKKNGYLTILFSIIATIVIKGITYHFLYLSTPEPGWYAFFYGRQLLTALDNFVIGMFIAFLVQSKSFHPAKLVSVCLIILGLIFQFILCDIGLKTGIHTNNISGYVWHSAIALFIGMVLLGCATLSVKSNVISSLLLKLASIEYVVYLWHLPVFNNLLNTSPWINALVHSELFPLGFFIMIGMAILVGIIFSKISFLARQSPTKKQIN